METKYTQAFFFDADSIWAHANPAQNVGIMAVSFCIPIYFFLYPQIMCNSECKFYISEYII